MSDIERVVVSDSTPLIYLAKIGRLSIVRDAFTRVFIPDAVFKEAVTQGEALNMTDAAIIENAVGTWIIREQVKPEVHEEFSFIDLNTRMGLGEKEALMLCKQLRAKYFIADDREARTSSKILNIKAIGTLSIIVNAYERRSVTDSEALQILDELVRVGFRIDTTLYRRILDQLNRSA